VLEPALEHGAVHAGPDVDCGGIYDCYEDHGAADRSTVALTTVLYDPSTGRLFDADMEVNGWDGVAGPLSSGTASAPHGYYFTCDTQAGRPPCTTYGQADCNGFDLRNTVTHEAGHVVGLAHPCGDAGTPSCDAPLPPWETVPYAERTMYPSTTLGETSKRALSPDDVAGVCAAYPVAGGCGCGSAGGPGRSRSASRPWRSWRCGRASGDEHAGVADDLPGVPVHVAEFAYRTSSAFVAPSAFAATSITVVGRSRTS